MDNPDARPFQGSTFLSLRSALHDISPNAMALAASLVDRSHELCVELLGDVPTTLPSSIEEFGAFLRKGKLPVYEYVYHSVHGPLQLQLNLESSIGPLVTAFSSILGSYSSLSGRNRGTESYRFSCRSKCRASVCSWQL